ncbi:Complement C1q tumor necrosis factor-related 3/sw-like protein [Daphnia magna]|uniref:Complement C1q tumor necrosis factor-related 3/sw-like protein n=1 Tax=Daphnia magna TaxID=35525 RepID=A0A164UNN6_9CRUS|nr:Complement C1q tumor necrosis factor-related 3/sw-like protein [Daphnia magna]
MTFALLIVIMQNSRIEQVETARFGGQEDPSIPFEVERVNITRIYGLGKFTSPRAETIFFTFTGTRSSPWSLHTFATARFFQLLLNGPKVGKAFYAKTPTIQHLESQKVNF